MLAFSFLVLLLVQRQQTVTAQQGGVLKALVSQTCLQSCYISECPNLDPACVCSILAGDAETASLCSDRMCSGPGEQDAFAELLSECIDRADGLGVVFDGDVGAGPPEEISGGLPGMENLDSFEVE
jgi:hypothetical protein